jgi:3-demethoxyubiquinol 3-hydroxylase
MGLLFMNQRNYSLLDHCLMHFEKKLQYFYGKPQNVTREDPSDSVEEGYLSLKEKKKSAALMRVNHAGEVCAQALYEGQAFTAKKTAVKQTMQKAADEEIDHLSWCAKRLDALGSHSSYLNPLWYAGSFSIGAFAGVLGDSWSFGFLAETERQVEAHIESHLKEWPEQDKKSRLVLEQMKIDEAEHATMAIENGAAILPVWVKQGMRIMSRVMTKTAYWL